MPNYDLLCTSCNKEFKIRASISERTEKKICCPECGSNNLEAVFKSAYYSIKKDAAVKCANSSVCGSGCPHAG